jgi:hypothetical protein
MQVSKEDTVQDAFEPMLIRVWSSLQYESSHLLNDPIQNLPLQVTQVPPPRTSLLAARDISLAEHPPDQRLPDSLQRRTRLSGARRV